MLKLDEERMKITLIIFVCVIFPSKWSLKSPFLTQKGVKNQNFKKSKKVPLDILEIHVVSKFGPIPMKIAAGSLSEPHTYIHTYGRTDGRTDGLFSTLVQYYNNILLYSDCLPRPT